MPLSLILRNRLKYALTRREVVIVCARRLIRVDGKVRSDINYPCGFMDVVSVDKSNERYRVLYDNKGRFILTKIDEEEANFKLVRIQRVDKANKASMGRNPFHAGQAGVVPYIVTHDSRTIRYPDPVWKVNDTLKLDLKTGKPVGHLKFDIGQLAFVTRGANQGRIGTISAVDKHPASFDVVHIKDAKGHNFATRLKNVFIIGEGKKEWVKLPRSKGIKLSILEERDQRKK
jgi:small subunit ribosomal protein S4e